MDTKHFVSKETRDKVNPRQIKKTPIVLSAVLLLYMLLGGHSAQAWITCEEDSCGGGGTTTEDPVPEPEPAPRLDPAPPPSYAVWKHAHGDRDNSGFAKIVTAPATAYTNIADVGPLAPGANPVTGADGTVYIGNLYGEMIALYPDGTQRWRRKLDTTTAFVYGSIYAAPVIGNDGSVYAVSGYGFRDHRAGYPSRNAVSFLHKFHPGTGQLLGSVPFPMSDTTGGASTAPPSIWTYNGAEAIIVPTYYGVDGQATNLVAFSTDLAVLDKELVTRFEVTGKTLSEESPGEILLTCLTNPLILIYDSFTDGPCRPVPGGFTASAQPANDSISLYQWIGWGSGVAMRQQYAGESPHIFLRDGAKDTVDFVFDMNTGFRLLNRTHNDERVNLSTPVALSSGGMVIGKHTAHETLGGISLEPEQRYLWLDSNVYATPTVTPNGRIAVVSSTGWLSTVLYGGLEKQEWNSGPSIASAASSCTHLFVATENELVTYDLATMQWVYRFPWTDGGKHSTIIGPFGHVYATTEHGMYVFPPAPNRNPKDLTGTQCT